MYKLRIIKLFLSQDEKEASKWLAAHPDIAQTIPKSRKERKKEKRKKKK